MTPSPRVLPLLLLLCGVALISAGTKNNRVDFDSWENAEDYEDGDYKDPPPGPTPGPQPKHADYEYVTICVNGTAANGLERRKGKETCDDIHDQIAIGRYANLVNKTGWGILEIETYPGFDDKYQAYAAGLAEGELTRLQLYYHYRNTIESMCKNHTGYCKKLYKYLTSHLDWVRGQVVENGKLPRANRDPYWNLVTLLFTQVTGIYNSYVNYKNESLTPHVAFDITPIYMMQVYGDLFDLSKYLKKKPDPQEYPEAGRCSGFAKLTPNNQDLLFAHVAMSGLETMNRIVKLYKFAYDKTVYPGYAMSFSGYPGQLASADDYTLTSAGLASIETTHAIFNETLYELYIKPEGQLHCWVRSVISNIMARTSKEWVDIFGKYNSGTYNNQWTVLDYKLFTPGQTLPDGALWISEQVPGFYESRDMTWYMRAYSYWPSYNIPAISRIRQLTGFGLKERSFNWYKWGSSPRAIIFDRDHHKVTDIDTLTDLMRYNNYTHDPAARCKCDPPYTGEGGISARGDLNPSNGTWEVDSMGFRNHAGLDFKGTNFAMFKQLRLRVWGGPPFNADVPAFDWRTTRVVTPHFGQPDLWNFTYIDVAWEADVGVDFFRNK